MEASFNRYEIELIDIYQKAEADIIAIIARKEKQEYVTYGEKAALARIRGILQNLATEAVLLVPKMTEAAFLYGAALSVGRKKAAHIIGEGSNRAMVDLLTKNLTGEITDAARHVGRMLDDAWRASALEAVAAKEAGGFGANMAARLFAEKILDSGLTAFEAENGAEWSLRTYAAMATRSVNREATNAGTLFADPDHDLYMISSHASSCPICAPLEGRIYSRSGLSSEFPALTVAFFGRKDPDGPDTLDNAHLSIHPNCRHVLIRVSEDQYTREEWDDLREFSNRPFDEDLRSKADVENYRKSQEVRRKLRDDYDQFQRYKLRLGDDMPKTFQTFQRVKANDPERFAKWRKLYREAGEELKAAVGE